MKKLIVSLLTLSFLVSCYNESEQVNRSTTGSKTETEGEGFAERRVNAAIKAHGGELYEKANYTFTFRKKKYQFTNSHEGYTYSVQDSSDKTQEVCDSIVNGKFDRYIDGKSIELTEEDIENYTGALNSVIYFATLPHKLNDRAVNKKHIAETTIKEEQYDLIEVTFSKNGGGKDHDDEFHYWINKKTDKIDYLAYNYRVNGGGVRFRSAYNRRVVDGITFQDYINWEATVGIPLKDLPALFEQGKLQELSRIETENVTNLNK